MENREINSFIIDGSYFLDYQSITKVGEKKGCSLVQLKGQRAKNANVGKYFTIILEFSNQWLTFKRSTFPTSEITFPSTYSQMASC